MKMSRAYIEPLFVFKLTKECLRTSISPGLILGILQCSNSVDLVGKFINIFKGFSPFNVSLQNFPVQYFYGFFSMHSFLGLAVDLLLCTLLVANSLPFLSCHANFPRMQGILLDDVWSGRAMKFYYCLPPFSLLHALFYKNT